MMTNKKQTLIFTVLMLMTHSALSKQYCRYDGISKTTPSKDFELHGNGTVTHLTTGLMWKVCSQGQSFSNNTCMGTATKHNWKEALEQATNLNKTGFAGHKDWRVPNANELITIGDSNCIKPAFNLQIFPNSPSEYITFWSSRYWSSTPSFGFGAMMGNFFWGPSMLGGMSKNAKLFVRLVRTAKAQ